jgi:hypothetical protein
LFSCSESTSDAITYLDFNGSSECGAIMVITDDNRKGV